MTKSELLALARECCITPDHHGLCFVGDENDVIAFANAIIEKCADSCHRNAPPEGISSENEDGFDMAVDECSFNIREMKVTTHE